MVIYALGRRLARREVDHVGRPRTLARRNIVGHIAQVARFDIERVIVRIGRPGPTGGVGRIVPRNETAGPSGLEGFTGTILIDQSGMIRSPLSLTRVA
jgi:hypothetical protein